MTPEPTTGCPACDALPASQRRAAHALCHPRPFGSHPFERAAQALAAASFAERFAAETLERERTRYAERVRQSAVNGVVLGSR